MIHLDVKKLGRIERAGHRIHGDRTTRARGAGWEYVHVCIDDASRLAYVEVLRDEKGLTTVGFLQRATAWYAERGIKVRRVMSDNGSNYVSKVSAAECKRLAAVRSAYRKMTSAEIEAHPASALPQGATFERIDVSERIRSASFGHKSTLVVRLEQTDAGVEPVEFWVEYGRSTNHPARLFGPFPVPFRP